MQQTLTLCVDEQLIPFKGKSTWKQYLPNKLHKWVYRFFVLSSDKGVVHDIISYTGNINPGEAENVINLKASANIVLHLA